MPILGLPSVAYFLAGASCLAKHHDINSQLLNKYMLMLNGILIKNPYGQAVLAISHPERILPFCYETDNKLFYSKKCILI